MDRLKDRVIIVTGGANGIGKAYCEGLAEEGARVVVADIDSSAAVAPSVGEPTLCNDPGKSVRGPVTPGTLPASYRHRSLGHERGVMRPALNSASAFNLF